jgi:hypothetical protein
MDEVLRLCGNLSTGIPTVVENSLLLTVRPLDIFHSIYDNPIVQLVTVIFDPYRTVSCMGIDVVPSFGQSRHDNGIYTHIGSYPSCRLLRGPQSRLPTM